MPISDESQPDASSQAKPAPAAYEPPDSERPASASPTERELGEQLPVGRDARRQGHDPYAALRIADYRLYAVAFWVSVIGGQTQNVAVGWEIYHRTNSALSLGWLGLVMATPTLLLALPAGHLADTHSRRRIMLATQSVSALCSLGLALFSYALPSSTHGVLGIYALMLVGNSAATFGRPSRAAIMPQLVPTEIFPNAVTWNSSIFETASMLGPAVGGLVCSFSLPLAYVFTFICWLVTMALVFLLPDSRPVDRGTRSVPTFSDLIAGVRFVWHSKLMLGVMTLDMFAVLLGGVTFLLPIFAQRLGGGALAFGVLRAAPSIGALTTAMVIAHSSPFQRAGRALLLAVAGFGAATIVFGLSSHFYLSFAMLVLTGACDNVSVVIRHTVIQLLTPDPMRGRVSAVNQVFIGSSNEIGGLESGLTAAAFGPVASVIIGGIGTILVVCGVAAAWPEVRKLLALHDVRPEPIPPQSSPRGFEVVQSA